MQMQACPHSRIAQSTRRSKQMMQKPSSSSVSPSPPTAGAEGGSSRLSPQPGPGASTPGGWPALSPPPLAPSAPLNSGSRDLGTARSPFLSPSPCANRCAMAGSSSGADASASFAGPRDGASRGSAQGAEGRQSVSGRLKGACGPTSSSSDRTNTSLLCSVWASDSSPAERLPAPESISRRRMEPRSSLPPMHCSESAAHSSGRAPASNRRSARRVLARTRSRAAPPPPGDRGEGGGAGAHSLPRPPPLPRKGAQGRPPLGSLVTAFRTSRKCLTGVLPSRSPGRCPGAAARSAPRPASRRWKSREPPPPRPPSPRRPPPPRGLGRPARTRPARTPTKRCGARSAANARGP